MTWRLLEGRRGKRDAGAGGKEKKREPEGQRERAFAK